MPRRPKGSTMGAPPRKEMEGSIFDKSQGNPDLKEERVVLDLPVNLREHCQRIIDRSPFLRAAQLPAVVRLARMEMLHEKILVQLEADPYLTYEDPRSGATKASPLIAESTRVWSQILAAERALAISIPTRREQITKEEERGPGVGATGPNDSPQDNGSAGPRAPRAKGAPKLRIA